MKVQIESHKKNISKEITFYRTPKKITIPLIRGNDKNLTEFVKKGDYVTKGQILAHTKKDNFPLYSPISGTITSIEEKLTPTQELIRSIIIENDFEERTKEQKNIEVKNKQDYIELIKQMGIVGLGGAGFPTYLKYNTEEKIKTLMINAVECEPYINTDASIIINHSEEILSTIDTIIKLNKIKEAIIVLKKENKEAINKINAIIGTYPSITIKTVKNYYPAGWERNIIKEIKNIEYQNLPIEQGIIVNNVSTIYAIYEALKYQKPLIERTITIAGEGIKEPKNITVKIGTSAKEVIESVIGYKRNKELLIIAGGPMMGKSLPTDDFMITATTNAILVLKNKEEEETTCIRCGKCIQVCPAKICPVLIKDSVENKENLKKLDVERCIGCGLCSYICPAKIPVRNYIAQAKKIIKEGR